MSENCPSFNLTQPAAPSANVTSPAVPQLNLVTPALQGALVTPQIPYVVMTLPPQPSATLCMFGGGGVQPFTGNAGVLALNGLSGIVNILGAGNISVSLQGQNIVISGAVTGYVTQAQLDSLSGWSASAANLGATGSYLYNLITGASGVPVSVSGYITTGQADLRYYPLNANPSGYVTTGQTGQFASVTALNSLSGFVTGISGYLAQQIAGASAGVSTLNGLSGNVNINATGGLSLSLAGQTIWISGQDWALSGDLTSSGVVLGAKIDSLSGYVNSTFQATGSLLYGLLVAASGVAQAQNDLLSGYANATFATIVTTNAISGNLALTGSVLDALIRANTGRVISVNGQSGVLSLLGTGTVAVFTSAGQLLVSGTSADFSGYLTTGSADLRYYPLGSNPSGFITTGQTGQFYPTSNPQQYATTGDLLAVSGVLQQQIIDAGADVQSINGQSGVLTISGTGGLTVLSGAPGLILISGDQSISGALSQTGATLNNKIDALSGFVGQVSGALNEVIVATGTAAVVHANGIGTILSGNLTQSGIALYQIITGLSGASAGQYATIANLALTGSNLYQLLTGLSGSVNAQIALTGQQAWTAADNNAQNLSGNLTITGQTLYRQLTGFSGSILSFVTGIPTGFDQMYVDFSGYVFPAIPRVVVSMETAIFNVSYGVTISGRTTTGFFSLFTDIITESGLSLNVIVKS